MYQASWQYVASEVYGGLNVRKLEFVPLRMGSFDSHMGGGSGAFCLYSSKFAASRQIRDEIIQFLSLLSYSALLTDLAQRIFEHDACDDTGFACAFLPKIGVGMIQKVIKRFRAGLVSYGSE
jgi:hypothetical protein